MVDTRSAIQALESQYDLKGVPAPSYASAIDSPQSLDWPVLNEAAYHGLAGDIVKAIEPVTEADPVALLVTTLLYFGSVIGRTAHAVVEDTPHYGAEFALIVGNSAFARKGTSEARIAEVFRQVEPDWTENNLVQGGMSSGEGLINLIRDPAEIDGATEQGISDKRRLIFEPEFARVLRVLQREGNNLSAVLRAAWDGRTLTTITKTPMKASTPHISVLGHIVEEELTRRLADTEQVNGFANRIMYFKVKRSRSLPFGGGDADLRDITPRLRAAIDSAKQLGRLERTEAAREQWAAVYDKLMDESRGGMFGAITARGISHVLRLSVIYAALDGSEAIDIQHQTAALALWDYSDQSARAIFSDGTGNRHADLIYRRLRKVEEMTKTDISAALGRNALKAEIDAALGLLVDQGTAEWADTSASDGRSMQVLRLKQA